MLVVGFLAVAIFLGFEYFQKPKPNAPVAPLQTQQQSAPAFDSAGSTPSPAAVSQPAAGPAITAASETETTVENPNYRIVFTNRGAQVKHWTLKHYFDSTGKS